MIAVKLIALALGTGLLVDLMSGDFGADALLAALDLFQ